MLETGERKVAWGLSILIVDDDIELASNLKDILEEEGYITWVAHDGRSARSLGCEIGFDLGIVDIKLPDISGVDLVQGLGDVCPGAEFVIVTGYASLDTAVEVVRQRAIISYETKPLDMERFLSFLRLVAERRSAQEALRQTEMRLRLLLERVPCVLWTTDNDLRLTSSIGAGLAAMGHQANEIVGMTLFEYFHTEDEGFPAILAHHRALEGMGTTYELEWLGARLHCCVEPFKDTAGNMIGVAGVALDITRRSRAERDLQMLSRRLVESQENERRAIGRELHDEIGQYLTALKLLVDKALCSGGESRTMTLQEAQTLVAELMGQVRDLSLNLRPPMLDDLGLLAALLWHVERYTAQTHVKVKFEHSGLQKAFPAQVATAAYRIVQEALTNVARHARTDEVAVRLWADSSTLSIWIKDNGAGFDPAALVAGSSGGLNGMTERALMLGGRLTIDSAPGAGTSVIAELPFSDG